MKRTLVSVLILALTACAVNKSDNFSGAKGQLPFVYGEFAFKPSQWNGGSLTPNQSEELEDCKAMATPKAASSKLYEIYGLKKEDVDFYGATLTGCLSDEKDGKGWLVQRRTKDGWESVKSRFAARSFLGQNPNQ